MQTAIISHHTVSPLLSQSSFLQSIHFNRLAGQLLLSKLQKRSTHFMDPIGGALCGIFGCDGRPAPFVGTAATPTNMMMQSQTFARGNVVVDVEVDIYYDSLEYDEDAAADLEVIDVGKKPILLRGGGSPHDDKKSRELSPKRLVEKAKRGFSPKRFVAGTGMPPPPPLETPVLSSEMKGKPPPPPAEEEPEIPTDFLPPPPPDELPLRFLRAGKNDPVEGQRRYEQTLKWRKEYGMDTLIREPHPHFIFIKEHYPQFFHLRGRNNEPVWYERPPKVNLRAMREAGINLDALIKHYAMVTDFGWQYLEPDDMQRSITVIDLEGMRMTDFAGEVVDFTRKCSAFTGDHFPERAGYVIVVNVPSWFKMIWNVVKSFIDDVTLQKISIVRGKKDVFEAMLQRIPIENIPPEYGGQSMQLGQSPEEQTLRAFMIHNLAIADGTSDCAGVKGGCPYCTWRPTRAY